MKLSMSLPPGGVTGISQIIGFDVILQYSCIAEVQVRSSIEWTEPS